MSDDELAAEIGRLWAEATAIGAQWRRLMDEQERRKVAGFLRRIVEEPPRLRRRV
jgi:hypothetical protein